VDATGERGAALTTNLLSQVNVVSRCCRIALLVALFATSASGHAQEIGRSAAFPAGANSAPAIEAISPNSTTLGGRAFTLSVVGLNFGVNSVVQWNGQNLLTTYVSAKLITASVSSSDISSPGSDAITVIDSASGSVSNSLTFEVPCVIAPPSLAATQTKARVGAYYFDGWSSPLTNFHFAGMPLGPYKNRQPFSGWQDAYRCSVEQQLASAHNFGVDFFVFDWYFDVQKNEPGDKLNSALAITHALPDRHGMQYAILYVDSAPFVAGKAEWSSAVKEWVGYMKDPAYMRINGMPAFFIIDVGGMYQVFGSDAGVSAALNELRAAAQTAGLPGVYVVGGFGQPDGTLGQNSLDGGFSIAGSDGYDAVAFYNYPFAPPAVNGMLPFSKLCDAARWTWYEAAHHSSIAFIPTAMAGWDPRPWDEREPNTNDLMWYSRTPKDVANLLADAIRWVDVNPKFRPEPAPAPPLVLIEAWNELGEGSYIVPTAGDGTSYGDAIAGMLLRK
jgi:Glycosyltransferase WbsX